MTMTAKFAGRCKACGQAIAVGDMIRWSRATGACHATQSQCSAAVAALEARRQAFYTANAPQAVAAVVDMSSVVAFLAMARERGLKAPHVHFLDSAQREITLKLAKETSANQGAVYVMVNGQYVGKITAERVAVGLSASLVDTLTAIAADPATAAKAYAALHGRCSFCNLHLTDAGSVEVGYGPVCAKHYGLPHKALGSNALQTVAA
jgi:Family of unknown function (DUF6011)